MFKVAVKSIWAHKIRFLFTGVAIVLGVGFMAGTFVLTDTVQKSFDDLFATVNEGTDVMVRGEEPFDSMFGENNRLRIPESILERVLAVDGVESAEGTVEFPAQLVGADGKTIGGGGPPTFGINWGDNPDLNPFCVVDPAPSSGDCNDTVVPAGHRIVIDKASAEAGELRVGDTTQLLTQQGPVDVEIAGIARFGEVDSPGGASISLFDLATAQELADAAGQFNAISVVGADGVSQVELRDRIATALDGQAVDVITGDQLVKETRDQIAEVLSFISTPLLFFAGVSIFVGTFVVYNVFNIVVAQRTREMALLRAIGASRGGVLRAVLGESIAVGVVASLLGLGFGIVVAAGLRAALGAGLSLPAGGLVVAPRTILVSMIVGVVITTFCGIFPAVRASRTPPVAAMSAAAIERTSTRLTVGRLITGIVVTALGVLLLLLGLFGGGEGAVFSVGLGAVLIFIGVFVLGPLIAKPVSSALGRQVVGGVVVALGALMIVGGPLFAILDPSGARVALAILAVIGGLVLIPAGRSAFGVAGRLGRENAMRNPKRTAAASAALMIGVALVGLIAIFAASLEGEVDATLQRAMRADFVVAPNDSFSFVGFTPEIGRQVAERTGTDADDLFISSSPLRVGVFVFEGQSTPQMLGAAEPETFTDPDSPVALFDFDFESVPTSFGTDAIAISDTQADDLDAEVGDTLTLQIPRDVATPGEAAYETVDFEVVGIYREGALTPFAISLESFEEHFPVQTDIQVFAKLREGVPAAEARAALDEIVAAHPDVKVQDQAEYRAESKEQIAAVVNLVYVLLAFAVVIAAFGIAITLALSVFERTREIGLLRAVGMSRVQMRSSIRWESVLVALLGTVLGVVIAVFFGWALIRALESEGFRTFVVPAGSLLVVVLVAVVIGVVTAVYPAWRASRMNVLEAIAHE